MLAYLSFLLRLAKKLKEIDWLKFYQSFKLSREDHGFVFVSIFNFLFHFIVGFPMTPVMWMEVPKMELVTPLKNVRIKMASMPGVAQKDSEFVVLVSDTFEYDF